jgi:hypothetical protein
LRARLPFIALGLLLALAAVAYLRQQRRKPPAPPSAALLARHGCVLASFPDDGYRHVSSSRPPDAYTVRYGRAPVAHALDGTTVTYDSFPPTSGPHYPMWVLWGTYTQPVLEIQAVHNLEHGGIVVQYGKDVSAETRSALTRFVASSPNAMLLAPLPALGAKVALTAWTYRALCSGFDSTAYLAFRDTFRFKGPERFPASDLTPGH